MNNLYAKSYTEVLEILKYLPIEEYKKIPKEEIEFYQNNCDKQYKFKINPSLDLKEQNISRKANAVLVYLFKNYFATEVQKEKLNDILKNNLYKEEQLKKEKYSTKNIFHKKRIEKIGTQDNTSIVPYKENIFIKIMKKIKNIFR